MPLHTWPLQASERLLTWPERGSGCIWRPCWPGSVISLPGHWAVWCSVPYRHRTSWPVPSTHEFSYSLAASLPFTLCLKFLKFSNTILKGYTLVTGAILKVSSVCWWPPLDSEGSTGFYCWQVSYPPCSHINPIYQWFTIHRFTIFWGFQETNPDNKNSLYILFSGKGWNRCCFYSKCRVGKSLEPGWT